MADGRLKAFISVRITTTMLGVGVSLRADSLCQWMGHPALALHVLPCS